MKRILCLSLSLLLCLSLLPASVLARSDPGSYVVTVARTMDGEVLHDLKSLPVGTEIDVSVTLTRTDVDEDTYNCRGMEIDINDYGLDYIEDSAVGFEYTVGGVKTAATVGGYQIGGATGVGNLRFFFIYGSQSSFAGTTFVPRAVTVSARYRVTNPKTARAWSPKPIIYVGGEQATDIETNEYVVTFDAAGGVLAKDPSQVYSIGEAVELPTPTRPGYRFLGWYSGGERFSDSWTVDGDKTFTARWERLSHTVVGRVLEKDGSPVPGATVKLVKGSEEFGSTVTDENGSFALTVDDDTYNLVAYDADGDRTMTELVEVSESKTLNITMPGGDKSSVLDNANAGDYAALVGGLDALAADETPAAGESVVITLTVTADANRATLSDQTAYQTEKSAIRAMSNNQSMRYFDLSLERTVTGGGNPGVTDISASNNSLLRVIIPFDSTGKTNVNVYRAITASGSGTAERLTAAPNAAGEHIVVSGSQIEIYAMRFSAYAIGYDTPGAGSYGGGSSSSAVSIKPPTDPTVTGVADWLITAAHPAYLRGYSNGRIAPNENITRAEVAMIFYRLLLKQQTAVTASFPDVENYRWYATAVNTLASLGILEGYRDGLFRPNDPITRQEFAAVTTRFAKATGGKADFSDVNPNGWAYDYIATASDYGWVNGYTDGRFIPKGNITRAEVATVVNHMLGRAADEAYVKANAGKLLQFPDLQDSSRWYYFDMVEAANEHDFTRSASGVEQWRK